MDARTLAIIKTERAARFRNLAGTRLGAVLPVTQRLVDMAVARASARRNLHGLQVTLRGGGEIGVEVVKPILGFDARIALVFRVAGPVDVASDPRLYLLVNPSLTWSTVSRLATAAGLAPDGVSIGRDGVAIDLRTLAARAGIEDLLSLTRSIELEGRQGVLIVRLAVDVPPGGVPRRAAQTSNSASVPQDDEARARPDVPETGDSRAVTPNVEMLLRELEGARVQGQISLGEDLANVAIGEALQSARDTGAGEGRPDPGAPSPRTARTQIDGSTLARWIQRAHVQFVNGRMVADVDVMIT